MPHVYFVTFLHKIVSDFSFLLDKTLLKLVSQYDHHFSQALWVQQMTKSGIFSKWKIKLKSLSVGYDLYFTANP